mmetsp:Transcript_36159/g.104039  ORF Transcript_36159/g.104039 Transcript_36159/m.104039 type:complete len:261 (+) Transcript_36159:314-1096(+)
MGAAAASACRRRTASTSNTRGYLGRRGSRACAAVGVRWPMGAQGRLAFVCVVAHLLRAVEPGARRREIARGGFASHCVDGLAGPCGVVSVERVVPGCHRLLDRRQCGCHRHRNRQQRLRGLGPSRGQVSVRLCQRARAEVDCLSHELLRLQQRRLLVELVRLSDCVIRQLGFHCRHPRLLRSPRAEQQQRRGGRNRVPDHTLAADTEDLQDREVPEAVVHVGVRLRISRCRGLLGDISDVLRPLRVLDCSGADGRPCPRR